MQNINSTYGFLCSFLIITANLVIPEMVCAQDQDDPNVFTQSSRWASSTIKDSPDILRITIHDGDNYKFLTEGHRDHKPVWSKEGDMLTFFRATGETDAIPFHLYRTHICVVKSDGTGFRELTDAGNPNVNPTWTRDGSNKIIFNRLSKSRFGNNRVFMISADAAMNDTLLISDPANFEWAESGLKDGRIFIFRINRSKYIVNHIIPFITARKLQSYYLLDPVNKKYEPVDRPNKFPTHKLSLSPSETKVVYMKDLDGKLHTYNDVVIAYAEFDSNNLAVKNEVVISTKDKKHIDMYPRWSPDERFIIYSSSRGGKMWDMKQYMYNLNTGETHEIPLGDLILDMYPCFEDSPK
jgi:Tol biopolymer transport system component